jgi:hypothetical protein
MAKYRKRPVVIEAFRLGHDSMPEWFCDARTANTVTTHNYDERWQGGPDFCRIHTLEGVMVGRYGDWIIRGLEGEIYPCQPGIFDATYEAVPTSDAGAGPRT